MVKPVYPSSLSGFITSLSIFSNLELVKLTTLLREHPEDEAWLNAVLVELGRREINTKPESR